MRCMDILSSTRFQASDFNNDHYAGLSCFQRVNNTPVLIMASKSANPPHYLITDGVRTMYYLRYNEALDCCKRMDCVQTEQ